MRLKTNIWNEYSTWNEQKIVKSISLHLQTGPQSVWQQQLTGNANMITKGDQID